MISLVRFDRLVNSRTNWQSLTMFRRQTTSKEIVKVRCLIPEHLVVFVFCALYELLLARSLRLAAHAVYVTNTASFVRAGRIIDEHHTVPHRLNAILLLVFNLLNVLFLLLAMILISISLRRCLTLEQIACLNVKQERDGRKKAERDHGCYYAGRPAHLVHLMFLSVLKRFQNVFDPFQFDIYGGECTKAQANK